MKKKNCILLVIVLILTHCSPLPFVSTQKTRQATTEVTFTSPSSTSIQFITATATKTMTPLPIQTVIPSPQPTNTLMRYTLTPSPFPTFQLVDREESIQRVLEFLENNDECRLPCWWGLTPGQTTLEETRIKIEPYSRRVRFTGDFQAFGVVEYFHLIPERYSITGLINTRFYFDQQILYQIKILELDWPGYHMRRFLHDYGVLGQVLFQTLRDEPGDHPPFFLYLFYPDQGILAYFFSMDEDVWRTGNKLHGCFRSGPDLYLWFPEEQKTLEEIVKDFNLDLDYRESFLLETISPYSPDTFYSTFQNDSGEDVCIEFTLEN